MQSTPTKGDTVTKATQYRSATLTEASAGHINVTRTSDGGFVGGYHSMAEAKRAVDRMLDRPVVTKVGPNTYRVES